MFHSSRGFASWRAPEGKRPTPARLRPNSRKGKGRPISKFRLSRADGIEVVRETLELFGSPRALTVWLLYKYGEHRQLVELSIDPGHYESSDSLGFRNDYAATKLLSKCERLRTAIDTEAVAVEAAKAAERKCSETNVFLRHLRSGRLRDIRGLESRIFHAAKAKIARVLGPIPSYFRDVGFSNGRTTSAFGDMTSPVGKYAADPHVTFSARKAALQLLRDCPNWAASVLDADAVVSPLLDDPKGRFSEMKDFIVSGNVMLIVPKNAKTGRSICYEPQMNIRFQLAVGNYIRGRLLRKAGINLNDQSINQRRAKTGSKDRSLSTLDLKAASDTLATELVWELLPIDWVVLLDNLRSKYTTWPSGETLKNEKFSSMGNGFTFELESLIFWAIACAVAPNLEGRVTVFGDDLVVPTEHADDIRYALELCGFEVNISKSYVDSVFTESCGKHYFGGVDVSPVFIRRPIRSLVDVILLHNNLRAWEENLMVGTMRRSVHALLKKWRTYFPYHLGPSGFGDGHYHVNIDDASPSRFFPSRGLEGWWFKTRVAVTTSLFEETHSFWHERTGKRTSKEIGTSLGFAALCAATGPKRVKTLWDSHVAKKRMRHSTIRTHATSWPGCWIIPG